MDLVMEAVERGLVPDALVRAGIRRLLREKLATERAGGPAAMRERRHAFERLMQESPIALHTDAANAQHYALPPEFFRIALGPRLKYSCALWEEDTHTLAAAEQAMLALTASRAGLADGQDVLELGCGWGSLTLWMAERFPHSRITAVSNSGAQRLWIEGAARSAGLGNVQVVTADMNVYQPRQRFDRIVSVEMFEHMRNWQALLARLAPALEPDGRLFVHVFCHREIAYPFVTDGRSDWLARYFFTGGLMPSEDLIARLPGPFELETQWSVNGQHYARTCFAWLANLDARRADALDVLATTYGARDARRWLERWRVFFLACAELFDYAGGEEWRVGHYLLKPRPVGRAPE